MSYINKEIAKRFFTLSGAKTQSELAECLNISDASVSQWMNGTRPVPRKRLMQIYEEHKDEGVSLDWVLGIDLTFPSDTDVPVQNFRTEAMGAIRDLGTYIRDSYSVFRNWWISERPKHQNWPDIEMIEGAIIELDDLDSLPFELQLEHLEKAVHAVEGMKDFLPESDFDSAESVLPCLVLDSYSTQLLSYRKMLMINKLANRVVKIEQTMNEGKGGVGENVKSSPVDPDPLLPGAIRMKTAGVEWPSPESRAAADTSDRTQAETVDGMSEPILPPEDTVLIPVHGRSMEPVLLDNQYAVVDWEDGGFKGDGGIYVVEVIDGPDATPEVFVKHCFRRGDEYVLQSVNPDVEDIIFPVAHVSRMWKVIGTWFMGMGEPAVFKVPQAHRSRHQEVAATVSPAGAGGASTLGAPPLLEIYRSVLSLQKAIADIGHQITLHPNAAKREWLAVQAAVDAAFDLHKRLLASDSDPHTTHPGSGEPKSA